MSQYSSQTVANLRAILKTRGIPCTGLTRKQQIIDKLVEADELLAAASAEQNEAKEDDHADQHENTEGDETQPANKTDVSNNITASDPVVEVKSVQEQNEYQQISDGQVESKGVTVAEQQLHQNDAQMQQAPKPEQDGVEAQPDEANNDKVSATQVLSNSVEVTPTEVRTSVEEAIKPVPYEDVEDDAKKRKRRSVTPSVNADDVANKRLRQSPSRDIVHLESDDLKVDNDGSTNIETVAGTIKDGDEQVDAVSATVADTSGVDGDRRKSDMENDAIRKPDTNAIDNNNIQEDSEAVVNDESRKENLLHPQAGSPLDAKAKDEEPNKEKANEELRDVSPKVDNVADPKQVSQPNGFPSSEEDEPMVEDANVAPALHTATSALYIRNFMRPLQPGNLKEHLLKLAVPDGSSPSDEVIQEFFIDSIRTHCFVCFSSVVAARRVRAALHNQIWPEESSRRPLWADYIPRDKVADFIKAEQQNTIGRSGVSIKWEVAYEESGAGFLAVLREVGSGRKASYNPSQQESSGIEVRGVSERQGAPEVKTLKEQSHKVATQSSEAPAAKNNATSKNFLALDSLFKSTTAKPKLYYLPVSSSLADERLKELHKLTWDEKSRRYAKSDELYRYTFANGTMVNDGPDRPPRRAPRPGRRRGFGGRGAYASRWNGRSRYP